MVQAKTILKSLPHILKTADTPNLGKKYSGKVRDYYIVDDKRVIITTDRQSAFDVILGHIPFKGAVLNLLSAFWFEKTKDIIPNHLISIPDPNVSITKSAELIPIEMVVRGYITGVTDTSIWGSYEKGERVIYGIKFPEGLKKNQKLPTPVITPTTKASKGHDERLTEKEILQKKIVSPKIWKQMKEVTLKLFERGTKICNKAGIILVDTKYEFGLLNGKLILIDELHTPDGSRFWIKKTYQDRFKKGQEPENFDKEFLRLWYAEKGYKGNGEPPKMSKDLIVSLSQRYISIYEKLTGKKFKVFEYPIEERIKNNLRRINFS
ncbi:phosphoribosylaminoimidazolesuccinocarboxamide synthase [Candidatus Daviesbacteria bacterium]|nr:phosphoribosylaminoimidazolesuccinocarboxamide synthase [Candidatus Daviesbacteria bacterium]